MGASGETAAVEGRGPSRAVEQSSSRASERADHETRPARRRHRSARLSRRRRGQIACGSFISRAGDGRRGGARRSLSRNVARRPKARAEGAQPAPVVWPGLLAVWQGGGSAGGAAATPRAPRRADDARLQDWARAAGWRKRVETAQGRPGGVVAERQMPRAGRRGGGPRVAGHGAVVLRGAAAAAAAAAAVDAVLAVRCRAVQRGQTCRRRRCRPAPAGRRASSVDFAPLKQGTRRGRAGAAPSAGLPGARDGAAGDWRRKALKRWQQRRRLQRARGSTGGLPLVGAVLYSKLAVLPRKISR